MLRKAGRARFSAANILLAILLGAIPLAVHAEGDSLFIQGSEVNLRASPTTQASVVAKLPIATPCQRLGDAPEGWVKVRCDETEGFTLKSLLGPEEPKLEPLLAQAKDKAKPVKERFDAAMRAATLKPEDKEALKWLHDLYFDSEFEVLAEDRRQGSKERFRVQTMHDCAKDTKCLSSEYIASGLETEFKSYTTDWFAMEVRKSDFIVVLPRDGLFSVFRGAFLGNANDIDTYRVDSQASFKVSPPLLAALASVSIEGWNSWENVDASDWNAPIDRKALERLREMPSAWFALSRSRGCVYRQRRIFLRRSFLGHIVLETFRGSGQVIAAIKGRKPRFQLVKHVFEGTCWPQEANDPGAAKAERECLARIKTPIILTWPSGPAGDNIGEWQHLDWDHWEDPEPFTSQPEGMPLCKED